MHAPTRTFLWWTAIVAVTLTVGCGPDDPQPKPTPLVIVDDFLKEAVVIKADNLQINSSEVCPIEIRARFPDKNGNFAETGAIAACSLRLHVCDRVFTTIYRIKDGSKYVMTPRIAERDPRYTRSGADCTLPETETIMKPTTSVGTNGALAYLDAVAAGQDFEDALLDTCVTTLEKATGVKSQGATGEAGSARTVDEELLKQDLVKWRTKLFPQ
jgi:hypothetical protein